MKPSDYPFISNLFSNPPNDSSLREATRLELLQKGALVALAQDGSPEAIVLLQTALTHPDQAIRSLSLAIVDHLAGEDNRAAVEALCQAAIQGAGPEVQALVVSRNYTPAQPETAALLYLLTGQAGKLSQLDPEQALITAAWQASPEEIRKRILPAARKTGLDDWGTILATVERPEPEALASFCQAYPHFKTEKMKRFARDQIAQLVRAGNQPASDAVCQLFIASGDPAVGDLAVSLNTLPADPVQRALFLFLASQWSAYETLDFDHSRLSWAYELADKPLRQRIISQARRIGHLEWAQALSGSRRVRWIGDLTDADWELALSALKQAGKWADLWRLVQVAPPVWSLKAFLLLSEGQWLPGAEDLSLYDQLNRLGANCIGTIPSIQKKATFAGHLQEITCLAMAPGKNIVASGSTDQSVRLWDVHRGQMSDILYTHRGPIRSIAFSPNGQALAIGNSDHSIQIYRLADHHVIKELSGHSATVRSLAFSPDGWLLASASFDHTVRLWRIPTGPELKTLSGHTSEVFCLSITGDGRLLASAGADMAIRLWSLPDGTFLKALEGHTGTITSLATSQDSQVIASGARDNTIRLWALPDGRLKDTFEPQKNLITSLGFHPDNQVLASGSLDGNLVLWSATTGKPWASLAAHQGAVTGLAFTPDGQTLLSSGSDRLIQAWALEDLLLARLPIDQIKLSRLNQDAAIQAKSLVAVTNQAWRDYTRALVFWRQRFDIEIAEPQRIVAGEFDIEL